MIISSSVSRVTAGSTVKRAATTIAAGRRDPCPAVAVSSDVLTLPVTSFLERVLKTKLAAIARGLFR